MQVRKKKIFPFCGLRSVCLGNPRKAKFLNDFGIIFRGFKLRLIYEETNQGRNSRISQKCSNVKRAVDPF